MWLYKQLFYCKRRVCPRVKRDLSVVPVSKLPWFWVGATVSENTICVTDIVNNNVKYGTTVTSKLLSELTHIDEHANWKYIDAKTLEEKDFPPEGIVIGDDKSHQPTSNT